MPYSDATIAQINDHIVDYHDAMGAPFRLFSTAFSPEPSQAGDVVRVPIIPNIVSTARTKTRAGAYAGDDHQPNLGTITLDQGGYVGADLSGKDIGYRLRTGQTPERIAAHVAHNFWRQIYDAFFQIVHTAVVLDATPGTGNVWFSGSGVTFSSDDVADIARLKRKAWGKAAVANMIIDTDLYTGLNKDADVKLHPSLTDVAGGALVENRVNRLSGMDFVDVDYITPGDTEQIGGIVAKPESIGVAFAPVDAAGSVGEGGLVNLEQLDINGTGLVITYREIYDSNTDLRYHIWESKWGAKVFDTDGVRYLQNTDL